MTAQEFRYEFDLLYNNIMSDMAPGLDDYEVSLFLTQAQEELVQQLYNGNASFDGFEANEKVRRNLANLIHNTSVLTVDPNVYGDYLMFDVALNPKILVLISERAEILDSECCNNRKWVTVQPVKYDEINKMLENPFRRPNTRKIFRIDANTIAIRLLSKEPVYKYEYNWLQKPTPIIVEDLPMGFTIDGVNKAQTSALDESLHRPIIKYAVQLAAASWASNNKS